MLAGFTAVTTFAGLFAAVPRLTATLVEPLLVQAVSQLVPWSTSRGPPRKERRSSASVRAACVSRRR